MIYIRCERSSLWHLWPGKMNRTSGKLLHSSSTAQSGTMLLFSLSSHTKPRDHSSPMIPTRVLSQMWPKNIIFPQLQSHRGHQSHTASGTPKYTPSASVFKATSISSKQWQCYFTGGSRCAWMWVFCELLFYPLWDVVRGGQYLHL